MPYTVLYSHASEADLRHRTFSAAQRARVRAAEKRYLHDQPDQRSAIRQPLDPNPLGATWELRLDEIRVCYDVDKDAQQVRVLRVLTKTREQYYLRGVPFEMRFP